MHRSYVPVVRCAEPDDAAGIAELYRQLVGDSQIAVLPERIAEIARGESAILLVAEWSGRIAGTALIAFCADVMYGSQPFAVIENVVVDTALRQRGIGRALLAQAEAICRARDCSKIMLLSSVSRIDAHRFFESLGFSDAAKRGFVKYRRQFSPAPV